MSSTTPTPDGSVGGPAPSPPVASRDLVPFGEALRTWFAISLQTFGGPAGQIAVMQRVLVEEKRWIGQKRFLHALSYCTLLPGPEAQQLAIYIGWLLNGTRGGLVAGILFVLPGVVALLALSAVYVGFGATTAITALFAGLAPALLAIVAQAVTPVGKRALAHPALVALAVAAFLLPSVDSVCCFRLLLSVRWVATSASSLDGPRGGAGRAWFRVSCGQVHGRRGGPPGWGPECLRDAHHDDGSVVLQGLPPAVGDGLQDGHRGRCCGWVLGRGDGAADAVDSELPTAVGPPLGDPIGYQD